MLSELYVVYVINNNDQLDPKNGWISKSTALTGTTVKVVRRDHENTHDYIKSFYSKRAAYQYANEVEKCLQQFYPTRTLTTQVQTKFLSVSTTHSI